MLHEYNIAGFRRAGSQLHSKNVMHYKINLNCIMYLLLRACLLGIHIILIKFCWEIFIPWFPQVISSPTKNILINGNSSASKLFYSKKAESIKVYLVVNVCAE